jgi:hypothetical protein
LLVVLCHVAALAGCSGAGQEPTIGSAGASPGDAASARATPTDDTVRLTLYFRSGEGAHAHLERVTRRVPVAGDLPRQALELLIAGPAADESGLNPPLPMTTLVNEIGVSGGTAHVVLSADVVHDALMVGESPANEALALAAITNTLTEFPSIDRVRVEVEGTAVGDGRFWGGWGVPSVLVRDESLVGAPGNGEGVPDLARFTGEPQTTGSSDVQGVLLSAVRVRDRLTHVRVIIELASSEEPDSPVKVPRVRAKSTSDEIVMDLSGVEGTAAGLPESRALELSDPAFRELRIEQGERITAVRLSVDDARERRFWLHSLTGPTRIVLDVKK